MRYGRKRWAYQRVPINMGWSWGPWPTVAQVLSRCLLEVTQKRYEKKVGGDPLHLGLVWGVYIDNVWVGDIIIVRSM